VVVGEHDKPFLRAGEVMAAKLPRSRHVIIPGAGHIVNIEEAELFNREMIEFLVTIE
jgi:pimeloyl-ACP methyl ester carboxylesterase